MNYDVLQTEIATDPLSRGYAAMTDAQTAASLNAAGVTVPYERFVTVRTLLAELGPAQTAAVMTALEQAADPDGTVALTIAMMKEYGTGGGLDLGHANARAFLDDLVAAGALTAAQAAATKALAEKQISRAEQLGLGPVSGYHLARLEAIA